MRAYETRRDRTRRCRLTQSVSVLGLLSESAQFETVCGLVKAPRRPKRLVADRGYDAKRIRAWLSKRRIRAVIPERELGEKRRRRGRPPTLQDDQYARRSAAERLIGWLKEYRDLATRFDKTAASFLAMVKLACIRRLPRAAFPYKPWWTQGVSVLALSRARRILRSALPPRSVPFSAERPSG